MADGNSVLITFAGLKMSAEGTRAWTDALAAAALPTVGHTYAIRGPLDDDGSYDRFADFKDLGDQVKALAGHFTEDSDRLVVVAHSSGSFMAHRFFDGYLMHDPGPVAVRVVYYNVDGAKGPSDAAIKKLFANAYAVHAVCKRDGKKYRSKNAGSSEELGQHLEKLQRGTALRSEEACPDEVVDKVVEAAAHKNEGWLLHFSLINHVDLLQPGATSGRLKLGDDIYKKCTRENVTADYLRGR
ncbi:MAG: hypothetical protein AUG04_08460 [Deltaproteobacteria bacterium 13_1_20CM_2_69_21]|nr:MAG: hypothetical protein AUG04_08460 [Deltaproteobacteria bacterium 13_1_20CM_2_69_21]